MNNYLKNRNSKEEWVYGDNKVGLSKEPNLTANIHLKEFYNGEGVITFPMPNYEGKPKQTPPKRMKKLKSMTLTKEAKSKIKRVCRMFDTYVKNLKMHFQLLAWVVFTLPKMHSKS